MKLNRVDFPLTIMTMFKRYGRYGKYRDHLKSVDNLSDCICLIPKFKYDKHINEGITKTYPTKNVLKKFYEDDEFLKCGYKCFSWNDDNTIAGQIVVYVPEKYDKSHFENTLRIHFASFGYYLAVVFKKLMFSEEEKMNVTHFCYQFEPRFQLNRKPYINSSKIYHITTKNGYDKIKKNGFCPRSNCLVGYEYPERIYFFTVYNEQLFEYYVKSSKKKNKLYIDEKLLDTREYTIITIDLKKIDYHKVQFFTDPNISDRISIFTTNNIPYSSVVDVKFLTIE